MKKLTVKALVEEMQKDFIVGDYIKTFTHQPVNKEVKYVYFFYETHVIKFTMWTDGTIWWECEGFLYYLRAEHLLKVQNTLEERFKDGH